MPAPPSEERTALPTSVPAEVVESPAAPAAPSSGVAEAAPRPTPRISLPEIFEKLRIPVQGVFVPVERQSHGYLRSALYNYHPLPG